MNCAASTPSHRFDGHVPVQAGNQPDNGSLDGVELSADSCRPDDQGQNGCVVKAPGASGYCPLISPPSNGKGNMVVQAVVYIPQSTFAGKFNNTGNFKIGTALIARYARHRHQPEPRRFAGHRRGHAASHQR